MVCSDGPVMGTVQLVPMLAPTIILTLTLTLILTLTLLLTITNPKLLQCISHRVSVIFRPCGWKIAQFATFVHGQKWQIDAIFRPFVRPYQH